MDPFKAFCPLFFISEVPNEVPNSFLKIVSLQSEAEELSQENLEFPFLVVFPHNHHFKHHVRQQILHDFGVRVLVALVEEGRETWVFFLKKKTNVIVKLLL